MTVDRVRVNLQQRQRRRRLIRIDYMPSREVREIMETKRARYGPLQTHSGILDAIVMEWADLTGIDLSSLGGPKTSASKSGIFSPVRARAYDFGDNLPVWAENWIAKSNEMQSKRRVICGARRHRDGGPCQALSVPGKKRCKWHGGMSTGPKTVRGKISALRNLKQNKARPA